MARMSEHGRSRLTPGMQAALAIANRDGAVLAGTSEHNGARIVVAASTLRALVARGLLDAFIGPDGGMGARLTPGRAPGEVTPWTR